MPYPMRQEVMWSELQQKIGISREMLEQALSDIRLPRPDKENDKNLTLKFSEDAVREVGLLHALISHPVTAMECVGKVSPDQITHPFLKDLFLLFEQAYLRNELLDVKSLPEKFANPAQRAFVASAVMDSAETTPERALEEAEQSIRAIRRRDIRKRTKDLEMKINDATRDGKPTRDLVKAQIELEAEFQKLSEFEL